MNALRKLTLFAAIFAVLALSVPASAQTQFDLLNAYLNGSASAVVKTADDSDVAFLIRYVGTSASGTVDVAANGDITLKAGAAGSEAVDTSIECDASIAATGSRSGIIDVSDSACDTVGEVMAIINGQVTSTGAHNWIAVPLDSLTSDDLNCGGSGCLVAVTGASASTLDGYGVKVDTDVALTSTTALVPPAFRKISAYVSSPSRNGVTLNSPNPFKGQRTMIAAVNATSTYASGTSTFTVVASTPSFTQTSAFTSTNRTLYSLAAGATATNKVFFTFSDNGRVLGDFGERLLVRVTNSAAMSSATLVANGITYSSPVAK